MNEIQAYLKRIVHRSGLSSNEQDEWVTEMSSHLFDEVEHLQNTGLGEPEAVEKALLRFGSWREIRKQIAKQTFGVTFPVIISLSTVFFALFLLGTYLLYATIVSNPNPSTWGSWHENPWVRFFTATIPISPSLMLALCLGTLMLVKTRCRKDRWALAFITSTFGVLWLFMRLTRHYFLAGLLVPGWQGFHSAPLEVSDVLPLCLSITTYLLTVNKHVSRFPLILSLAIGLWVPMRDAVQYHLWLATHWSGFWGHHDPNWLGILFMVGMQLVLLIVLKYVFRAIDRLYRRRRQII